MSNIPFNDELVLDSWNQNAYSWITAIENEEIESRKIVTNNAIIDAIMSYSPDSILDMGCGEGWLTRELTIRGMEAWGVDGVSPLIEKAKIMNYGKFLVVSYEDIVNKMDLDRQSIIKDKNTFGKQIKVKQNMIDELELKLKSAYLERDHYKELMDEGELKFENLSKQMSIVKQSDTLKTLKNSNLSNLFAPFQNLSYFLTFLCKVYISKIFPSRHNKQCLSISSPNK